MGSSGSSSDAQIFYRSNLRENGTLGLPPPEPLGEGGPNLHYFLLVDNTFVLMAWMVKSYSRRQLTRKEIITIYRISRCWMLGKNAFGILVNRFRVLLGTIEQRSRVVRDIFTCGVTHDAEDTPGLSRLSTNPGK